MMHKNGVVVKKSKIPGAGKGLFATRMYKKGEQVVEYKGPVKTWKEADKPEEKNRYLLYVNRNYVIDAKRAVRNPGRYANDASGPGKVKGLRNNSEYITERNNQVFITAKRTIQPGEEILVGYGKEYWDSMEE